MKNFQFVHWIISFEWPKISPTLVYLFLSCKTLTKTVKSSLSGHQIALFWNFFTRDQVQDRRPSFTWDLTYENREYGKSRGILGYVEEEPFRSQFSLYKCIIYRLSSRIKADPNLHSRWSWPYHCARFDPMFCVSNSAWKGPPVNFYTFTNSIGYP